MVTKGFWARMIARVFSIDASAFQCGCKSVALKISPQQVTQYELQIK